MEKSRDAARGVKLDFMTAKGEFAFEGEYVDGGPYGDGHINDTYAASCRRGDGTAVRYILQKLNDSEFRRLRHQLDLLEQTLSQVRENLP